MSDPGTGIITSVASNNLVLRAASGKTIGFANNAVTGAIGVNDDGSIAFGQAGQPAGLDATTGAFSVGVPTGPTPSAGDVNIAGDFKKNGVAISAGGGLLSLTVSLSSAQILAAAVTPVTVIPAPGAGKSMTVFKSVYELLFGTTPYTGGQGALFYAPDAILLQSSSLIMAISDCSRPPQILSECLLGMSPCGCSPAPKIRTSYTLLTRWRETLLISAAMEPEQSRCFTKSLRYDRDRRTAITQILMSPAS